MILEIATLTDVVIESATNSFCKFIVHVVHVYLGVTNLDCLSDGYEPYLRQDYQLYMSYLEVVLKMMLLNLSLTVNIFFFSFTISTSEFYKGIKDTFFSESASSTRLLEFIEC